MSWLPRLMRAGRLRRGWALAAAGALVAVWVSGPPVVVVASQRPTGSAEGAVADARTLASPMLLGANDFGCRPTRERPNPVVLVHGTFTRGADAWWLAAGRLQRNGYCVFSLDYGAGDVLGGYGLGPIDRSAEELATFIDGVLAATGADQVSIVGHSQGGLMPRHYLQNYGADRVERLIAISPTSNGTTLNGLDRLVHDVPGGAAATQAVCPACWEQLADSDFIRDLGSAGPVSDVEYTVIATKYDTVATPHQSQFMAGPNVTNHLVQDYCGVDLAGHDSMPYDGIVLRLVEQALDPTTDDLPGCLDMLAPF